MSDASIIRSILARECDTVNEYERLAEQAESPRVRSLILHFAEEEKEHIAECALVLARIDPEYERFLGKSLTHIDESWGDDDVDAASGQAAASTGAAEMPATAAVAPPNAPAAAVDAAAVHAAAVDAASPESKLLPCGARITNDPYAQTIGSLFRADRRR